MISLTKFTANKPLVVFSSSPGLAGVEKGFSIVDILKSKKILPGNLYRERSVMRDKDECLVLKYILVATRTTGAAELQNIKTGNDK